MLRNTREAQLQARRPGGTRPKKEEPATGPGASAEEPSSKESLDQSGEDIDPDAEQWDETDAAAAKPAPAPEKEAADPAQEQDDDAARPNEATEPADRPPAKDNQKE